MEAIEYDTSFAVAVDFDNTITKNSEYGRTGTLNPRAKAGIEQIRELGCPVVLWTTREGKDLEEAVSLLKKWDITVDYVNEYPPRGTNRKVNVDFYIDDKSWVQELDWDAIVQHIKERIGS